MADAPKSETLPTRQRRAFELLLVAVTYLVAGKLSFLLAIAPSYATAVWPPAGIALAAVLLCGRRVLPGIWLGSITLSVITRVDTSSTTATLASLAISAAIGFGSAMQAGVAAALVRRFVGFPNPLTREGDIVKFLALAGPVASIANATFSVAILFFAGAVPMKSIGYNWCTWWVGDTIGVLIFTPLSLMFCFGSAPEWRRRRLSVGLPLVVTFAIACAVFVFASTAEMNRNRIEFDRQCDAYSSALNAQLGDSITALRSLRRYCSSVPNLGRSQFSGYVSESLDHFGGLFRLSWTPRVPLAQRSDFERTIAAEGFPGFRIVERGPLGRAVPAPERKEYFPICYTEPFELNRVTVGYNVGVLGYLEDTFSRATDAGEPTMSGGFFALNDGPNQTAVLVTLPIYRNGQPLSTLAQRRDNLVGYANALYHVGDLVRAALKGLDQEGVSIRILDDSAKATPRVLFDSALDSDNKNETYAIEMINSIDIAGRSWKLVASRSNAYLLAHRSMQSWLVMVGGLIFSSLMGAFLLILTGRTLRIEDEVVGRTCELSFANEKLLGEIVRSESAEALAKASEDRLNMALNASGIGMWEMTIATGHTVYSPTYCQMLGYQPSELEPHRSAWDRLVHPDDAPAVEERLAAHLQGLTPTFNTEFRLKHAKGHWVWIQTSGRIVERDSSGRPTKLGGTNKDVTQQIQSSRELQLAKESAERADRAKSSFLANMSHEIRTPLTAILGYSEMLLKPDSLRLTREDCLQTVHRNAQHLLELINDVLDLSRIESGRMEIENVATSLTQLVISTEQMMRPLAIDKGFDVSVMCKTPMPENVIIDPLRLRQVLVNLLGNAIKFTTTGGVKLVMSSERASDQDNCTLRFEIIDTGIGVSEQQLKVLFQPFSQADSSTSRRFGGTGLGLAISQRLARALGGQITVSSQVGAGSAFTVTIPAKIAASSTELTSWPASRENPSKDTSRAAARSLSGKVLVVEDGPDNQRLIAVTLEDTGLDVEIADNGQVALHLAASHDYDLMVMDIQMPLLDGYDTVRQLRASGKKMPIIALTAHALPGEREKCMAAGCDEYLAKPIDTEALLSTIEKLLKSTAVPSPVSPADSAERHRSNLPDNSKIRKILGKYIEQLPMFVSQLQAALEATDTAMLLKVTHRLKGTGTSYGFPEITRLSGIAEAACVAGESNDAIAANVQELVDWISRVQGYGQDQDRAA